MDRTENLVLGPYKQHKKEQNGDAQKQPTSTREIQIDETDRKIARILSRSARTPFKRIAEQLGISTKNVIQRYRRLRREKVLTLSSITVDLNKLGYNAMA